MAERPDELIVSADVDNGHGFAAVELALEFIGLDPRGRPAQPFDQLQQRAPHIH